MVTYRPTSIDDARIWANVSGALAHEDLDELARVGGAQPLAARGEGHHVAALPELEGGHAPLPHCRDQPPQAGANTDT
eukprot:7454711-Pyramimonas_sp.AAC.1